MTLNAGLGSSVQLKDVTIGVLTALTKEYTACRRILDPDDLGREQNARATTGTFNCWLCTVPARNGGHHVVAISMLPDMGNIAAAIGANILLQHCPNTCFLIMSGIAGAVPDPSRPEHHVRLGDVVVSDVHGIIQYDRGKQHDPRNDGGDSSSRSPMQRLAARIGSWFQANPLRTPTVEEPFAGFDFRGPPRPPAAELLAAIQRIHADELTLRSDQERHWETHVARFISTIDNPDLWQRPDESMDILIDSPAPNATPIQHPSDEQHRRRGCPRVFLGPIGAANVVQADPRRRDYLRDHHGVKAIEMEGWGVADACWVANIGYLVVRGACDYCNSKKNNVWQEYASVVAAAYTRTIIEYVHPILSQPSVDQGVQHALSEAGIQSALLATVRGSDAVTVSQPTASPHSTIDRPDAGRAETADVNRPAETELLRIRSAVQEIERLMDEWQWSEIPNLATALEDKLRNLPQQGADVKKGWILLARVEGKLLRDEKAAGRPVNSDRLRQLREEAERVT